MTTPPPLPALAPGPTRAERIGRAALVAAVVGCVLVGAVLALDVAPTISSPNVQAAIARAAGAGWHLALIAGAVGACTRTRPGLRAALVAALATGAVFAINWIP